MYVRISYVEETAWNQFVKYVNLELIFKKSCFTVHTQLLSKVEKIIIAVLYT
jgi:hypothetical protein